MGVAVGTGVVVGTGVAVGNGVGVDCGVGVWVGGAVVGDELALVAEAGEVGCTKVGLASRLTSGRRGSPARFTPWQADEPSSNASNKNRTRINMTCRKCVSGELDQAPPAVYWLGSTGVSPDGSQTYTQSPLLAHSYSQAESPTERLTQPWD